MTTIDAYSLTTIPLELRANGRSLERHATGFIWKEGRQHYLITNWHVVTGHNAETGELELKVRPDELRTLFNTKIGDFGKQQWDIKIRDADGNPLWFVHPLRGRGSDVVALPLPMTGEEPVMAMYPINDLKSDADLAIRIGMDVFILGYPFPVAPPGFPVWKRGSVASEPDLTRLGRGFMLVDTASRPGMSGAPVIRRSWGYHLLTDDRIAMDVHAQTKFIGVYSGRLHTKDPADAQLGMVWPVEDIKEILIGRKLHED